MILNPAVIALLLGSCLVAGLMLSSSWYGMRILRSWDLRSGSALQLELERRTYLISTILVYVLAFQLFSLFLLVYTADRLTPLFTGAMCAAGTFYADAYGYPLLLLKIGNFLLAGVWLIVNRADTRAEDYPLIRKKYALLLALTPLMLLETFLLVRYFRGLQPDVITSCCGSLFSARSPGVTGDLAAQPAVPMEIVLAACISLTVLSGALFLRRGRGGYLLAFLSVATLLVGMASILSFISPLVYELPTHHCPFCLLQPEYHFIGYFFYASLLGGTVAGLGVGVLNPFRKTPSLATVVPAMQRRLAILTVLCALLFGGLTLFTALTSNLRL